MRILAGSLKGRKISPKALRASGESLDVSISEGVLRPTSSKVRESIFNILGERVKDCVFVDLYTGTGAVGMEAMSRQAKIVYFVESDRKRVSIIEETLAGCGCRAKAEVVRSDAATFIKKAVLNGIKADIVFLDPPYRTNDMDEAIEALSDGKMLAEYGIVLAEHLTKKEMPEQAGVLKRRKSYKYGDTSLSLYKAGG